MHSVKDPGFAITKEENKSWQASFSLSVVREKVKEVSGSDPGPISQVKVIKKGPSGRAMSVKLGNATVSGPALRLALGLSLIHIFMPIEEISKALSSTGFQSNRSPLSP